jgi:hypothetical protein
MDDFFNGLRGAVLAIGSKFVLLTCFQLRSTHSAVCETFGATSGVSSDTPNEATTAAHLVALSWVLRKPATRHSI